MQKKKIKNLGFLLTPSMLYMIIFFFAPIIILMLYSFWKIEGYEVIKEFSLSNYLRVLSQKINWILIYRSILMGLIVSFITVLLSYPAAYGLTFNTRLSKYKDYFLFMILIAMFSSYLIRVYAWRTILGDFGIINQILIALRIIKEPLQFLLYSRTAVIIALVHILTPFTILPIYSSMQNINPELLSASRDLGANSFKTNLKIVLPLCKSGLISGFIFSFILATGDYVIPALLGGKSGLMIGKLISDMFGTLYDWGGGAAITVVLIICLFSTFFLVIWLFKFFGFFEKIGRMLNTKKPLYYSRINKDVYSVKAIKWNKILNSFTYFFNKIPVFEIYTVIFLLYMFAPALIIIFFSFNAGRAPTLPLTGFTLNWYKTVLTDPNFLLSIRNSLIIAVVVSIGAGILGTAAAFAFKRFEFRFKNTAHFLLIFPITVPGLLLGISLLSFFVLIKIPLSLVTVILGHLVFTIPFVYINVRASLENFNETIEEAAKDLGANGFQVFTKITMPIIKSGIIGGMLIAFALSFDEFIVTFFIIGGGQNTVPMLIFSMLKRGIKPTINAISSLVLVASFIFISIANRITKLKVRL